MDDYKINEILPKLNQEKKSEVLNLLTKLGVENFSDLQNIEVEDLTKTGLLKLIQARKLVKEWRNAEKKQGKIITF